MKLFCVHCSYSTPKALFNTSVFVECSDEDVAESFALSYCKDVLHWSNPSIQFISLIHHHIVVYES